MLKKLFEITTKYQKEIIVGIILIILILLVLRKKQQRKKWLAPKYPITSPYRPDHRKDHNGVDYGGVLGSPILAIGAGVVEQALLNCTEGDHSCNGGNGNFVRIDHGNGYKSVYLHLSAILVKTGEKVRKGQPIGKMGNTGHSFGTHLHLSVTKDNAYINPETLFKA